MMPDAAVWEDIRVAYETTSETKKEIAARYGVSESAIYRYAKEHDWTLRPSGTAALLVAGAKRAAGITSTTEPVTSTRKRTTKSATRRKPATRAKTLDIASSAKPRKGAGTDTHQLAIIKRLYDVTDAKLSIIENRIASKSQLKPADAERESREIASILKTIEKLKELSDAFARTSAKSGEPKSASAALANDTERLRQDLAERFARLTDSEPNTTPAL